jgi:hypothetical protein
MRVRKCKNREHAALGCAHNKPQFLNVNSPGRTHTVYRDLFLFVVDSDRTAYLFVRILPRLPLQLNIFHPQSHIPI